MATSNPDDLAAFAGRWSLIRRIRDLSGGPDGAMEGEATFAPDGAGLIYRETGLLRLAKMEPIRAERSYLWRQGQPGMVEVLFTDGQPFHMFRIDMPRAEHFCDPDTYRVAYDFNRWPVWRAVWRVTGPKKNYEMTTDFAPLALKPGMGDTDMKRELTDGRGA